MTETTQTEPLFTRDDLLRIDGWIQFAKDMSGGMANTRTMSELRARIARYIAAWEASDARA